MQKTKDENDNIWLGPVSIHQIKKNKFTNKNKIYVWSSELPFCDWTSPHNSHRISLNELLKEYPNITDNIYLQENTLPRKKSTQEQVPLEIIVALIGAGALIIAAFITAYWNSPESGLNVVNNGNENITINGNNNTIFHENKTWKWEDLKGEVNGNFVKVRVAFNIITDEFRWKFSSYDELDDGSLLKTELPQYLYSLPDFDKAIGIIAVGMASEEGNPNIEIDRAGRRADNILLALKPHEIALKKEIYKLNLGIHENTSKLSEEETSYQRKIILIGIMDKTNNISFDELRKCLENALEQSGGLDFDRSLYSNFDLYGYTNKYVTLG